MMFDEINNSDDILTESLLISQIDNSSQRACKRFIQLNELHSSQEYFEKQKWYHKILFTPESKFILFWQLLNIILIYLYFMEIPITLVFQSNHSQKNTNTFFIILNIPAIIIFILGIPIKLKTSYQEEGVFINKQSSIINHYLKNILILDLLSILSILIYQFSVHFAKNKHILLPQRFIVLLFYLKIKQLVSMETRIIDYIDLKRRMKAFVKLVFLLTKLFMICNVVACTFFYLSSKLCQMQKQLGICYNCCWVYKSSFDKKKFIDQTWDIQYSYSLYWASTTMMSIGYGDIVPENQYQVIFTIFAQFLACLVFAYSINAIWSIIQQMKCKEEKIHFQINTMNYYMKDKKISLNLRNKVNAYLSNLYYKKHSRQRSLENQILSQLTPSLRKQLLYESYALIFKNNPFFESFSEDLLLSTCQDVSEVRYFKEENIETFSDENQVFLFYIESGQIQNYLQLKIKTVNFRIFSQGQTLGAYDFLHQFRPTSSFIAFKYSTLYRMSFKNLKKKLLIYQDNFLKFYQNRIKSFQEKWQKPVFPECILCQSRQHKSQHCFHFKIKQLVSNFIGKYRVTTPRNTFQRTYIKSKNIFENEGQLKGISVIRNEEKKEKNCRKVSISKIEHQSLAQNLKNIEQNMFTKRKHTHNELIQILLEQIVSKDINIQINRNKNFDCLIIKEINIDKVENYKNYFIKYNVKSQEVLNKKKNFIGY